MEELAAIVIVLAAVVYFVTRLIIFANAIRHKREWNGEAQRHRGADEQK